MKTLHATFTIQDGDYRYLIEFDLDSPPPDGELVQITRTKIQPGETPATELFTRRWFHNPKQRYGGRAVKPCVSHCQQLIGWWERLLKEPRIPGLAAFNPEDRTPNKNRKVNK